MRLQLDHEARTRMRSAAIVAALHLAIAYAFLVGLGADGRPSPERLHLLRLAQDPPPPAIPASLPQPEKTKLRPSHREGAASPTNLADSPTETVAPVPVIRLPAPTLLPTAPIAGLGDAPAAGAADRPGPGTGSGGQGQGLGSGTSGNGTGGGGGGAIGPRWLSGAIEEGDYPSRAWQAGLGGTVGLRFIVAPNGRVTNCDVTRSSGHSELDATTCRLILKRFRYRPARDAAGREIASTILGQHVWEVGPEPPPVEVEADVPDR